MTDGERAVLALLVRSTAEAVAEVLNGSSQGRAYSTLAAMTATRALERTLEDALTSLVRQARAEGVTWQQIGDALGTTRQNAYQRFGGPHQDTEGAATMATGEAIDATRELFEAYTSGDLARVTRDFDAVMKDRLTEPLLAAAWRQVADLVGGFLSLGEPTQRTIGEHVVVDLPLTFERGAMKGRAAYNPDKTVAGLFILDPSVP